MSDVNIHRATLLKTSGITFVDYRWHVMMTSHFFWVIKTLKCSLSWSGSSTTEEETGVVICSKQEEEEEETSWVAAGRRDGRHQMKRRLNYLSFHLWTGLWNTIERLLGTNGAFCRSLYPEGRICQQTVCLYEKMKTQEAVDDLRNDKRYSC